ncbi:MAG TPA: D-aminoacylase [Burkholderiales bacterium]|jgi:N-acyl-D-amino-acid deacylase|nr:D-aminoacylase [Burkholderiales bacterium]
MGYDLVVRNGTVVDGTRAARYRADVAVTGDRISALGAVAEKGTTEIDASGLVVAPGFIDAHTHDDRLMLSAPEMAPKVSQGVTTVVAGNCGISLAPAPRGMRLPVLPPIDLLDDAGGWFRFRTFGSYVKELNASPAATNCALLVGHTMLRAQTMEDLQRPATENEVEEMRRLAAEALASGAIGVSTGLYYEPARAATTEEVIQVCRPLAEHGGIYCTHMRDEGARVIDSLDESFRIGRELGVPVVISHHKVVGTPNHGRSVETLPFIERAMRSQRIALDCYPYCASSTILSYSRTLIASTTLVTWSKPHPEFAGCRLDEVAAKMGLGIEQAVQRLLPAGAIYFSMDEADVQRILAFEHTMIGSDGLPHDTAPHPRLWGSFPRVLGHYSRGLNLFPLETAVYKMTGLTAQSFGLEGRGVLREGAFADLAIFDPGAVDEAASFAQPIRPAKGIHAVIVNGSVVWKDGQPTGARPGRILRRGG